MRRENDFYPTPAKATEVLFKYCPELLEWNERAIEPCAGDGAISDVLKKYYPIVTTYDIDPRRKVDWICDAKTLQPDKLPAVITNPPFVEAIEIVSNFVRQGLMCAFLLRLSFLEPTDKRGTWLAENRPCTVIVLPRISFTGDGKTDNVTCAWMCWNIRARGVIVHPKEVKAGGAISGKSL